MWLERGKIFLGWFFLIWKHVTFKNQKFKIGPSGYFEKKVFCILEWQTLVSDELGVYWVCKSGFRFAFWAPEVPKPRERKRPP